MAFVTLGGTLDLLVVDISEDDPETIGDESRSATGDLRGIYIAEKRKWSMTLLEMSQADYTALKNMLMLGAQVSVAGDFIDDPTVVRGRIRGAGYVRDGADFLRGVRLELVEV